MHIRAVGASVTECAGHNPPIVTSYWTPVLVIREADVGMWDLCMVLLLPTYIAHMHLMRATQHSDVPRIVRDVSLCDVPLFGD